MEIRLVDLTKSKEEGRKIVYTLSDKKEISIGRNPLNDINISSNRVSRKQCKLYLDNGRVMIEDLGSMNGTYVNKTRIPENRKVILDKSVEISLGTRYRLGLIIGEDLELEKIEDSLDLRSEELKSKLAPGGSTEFEINV